MKCVVCGENEAEIRDRETPWSNRKKVCRHCHARRLAGDLGRIIRLSAHEKASQADGKVES